MSGWGRGGEREGGREERGGRERECACVRTGVGRGGLKSYSIITHKTPVSWKSHSGHLHRLSKHP